MNGGEQLDSPMKSIIILFQGLSQNLRKGGSKMECAQNVKILECHAHFCYN